MKILNLILAALLLAVQSILHGCTPGTIWPHVHVDIEKHATIQSDSIKALKMIK